MPLSPDDVESKLSTLLASDPPVGLRGVVFGQKIESGRYELYQTPYSDRVAEHLIADGIRFLEAQKAYAKRGLLKVLEKELGYQPEPGELLYVDPETVPAVDAFAKAIANHGELPVLGDDGGTDWSDLQMEARILACPGGDVVTLRRITLASVLKKSGKLAVTQRRGVLDMTDPSGLFMPDTVNAFLWDGVLFVKSDTAVDAIFDLFKLGPADAEEIIDSIAGQIPISGVDVLKDDVVALSSLAKKLARVRSKPYFATLTIDNLEVLARDYKLGVVFEGEGEARTISYEQSDRRALLKLLDDDFLESKLTGLRYAVRDESKRTI